MPRRGRASIRRAATVSNSFASSARSAAVIEHGVDERLADLRAVRFVGIGQDRVLRLPLGRGDTVAPALSPRAPVAAGMFDDTGSTQFDPANRLLRDRHRSIQTPGPSDAATRRPAPARSDRARTYSRTASPRATALRRRRTHRSRRDGTHVRARSRSAACRRTRWPADDRESPWRRARQRPRATVPSDPSDNAPRAASAAPRRSPAAVPNQVPSARQRSPRPTRFPERVRLSLFAYGRFAPCRCTAYRGCDDDTRCTSSLNRCSCCLTCMPARFCTTPNI